MSIVNGVFYDSHSFCVDFCRVRFYINSLDLIVEFFYRSAILEDSENTRASLVFGPFKPVFFRLQKEDLKF